MPSACKIEIYIHTTHTHAVNSKLPTVEMWNVSCFRNDIYIYISSSHILTAAAPHMQIESMILKEGATRIAHFKVWLTNLLFKSLLNGYHCHVQCF